MIYVDRKTFGLPFEQRVLGHYGDNCINTLEFEIGENYPNCDYIMYIEFPNGTVNSIMLTKSANQTVSWRISASDIFCSGLAYIQMKAIAKNGEIWHSPKIIVELLRSIDENTVNGEYIPTLFQQLDEKINLLKNLIVGTSDSNDYITRPQAQALITENIDELLLPLCRRLDGE